MEIENDKIIQATEDELYSYWLSRGWDVVYSFPEYMSRMKDAGCEVIAEIPKPTVFDRITTSPEVLAKSSVYCLSSDLGRDDDGKFTVKRNWKSPFIDRCYDTEEEAIAATVEKLKEVENGN